MHTLQGFILLLLYAVQVICQNSPKHSRTSFTGFPERLFFFDDSETAIYLDSQTRIVHVSSDEGKSWTKPSSLPQNGDILTVILHPFDNREAYALTATTKHYKTTDRGQTWRSFEVPIAPSRTNPRPLQFHYEQHGYMIYQGTRCVDAPGGWGKVCADEAFVTTDGFGSGAPAELLSDVTSCMWAHSSKEWRHDGHKDLIYCVAFDSSSTSGSHSISSSRLFSSTDFFKKEKKIEDLGIGRNAKGVVALAVISKFALVALRDLSPGAKNGEMLLFVTVDTATWAQAEFPHASSAQLRENAYTIVESTTHSLAVDVVLRQTQTPGSAVGTLFVSNSNGTYFVQSLQNTNRNDFGFVDFERVYGVEGVGLANIVTNAEAVETHAAPKKLQTRITFDDGSSWAPLTPPKGVGSCSSDDEEVCSLQLHSVTAPHNYGRIFSSPAPGLLVGVGAVSESLPRYLDSQTFLSIDAGLTWTRIKEVPYKFQFGDSGSVIVIVKDDERETVDKVEYSLDFGKSWKEYNFGKQVFARALLTVPDSTSQKFLLLGETKGGSDNWEIIHLDFAPIRKRQCKGLADATDDFERWNARPKTKNGEETDCLMGHRQWYARRKANADCYVGSKFLDPVAQYENCECNDQYDYECDFNHVLSCGNCIALGPEPIPPNTCTSNTGSYYGSSGWRKIPGDTCYLPQGKKGKDEKVKKSCSEASPKEGQIIHQTFPFPSPIAQHAYFPNSHTILVLLKDGRLFQSSNDGYNWQEPLEGKRFITFYHHPHSDQRAYLVTTGRTFYSTTSAGRSWNDFQAPNPPTMFNRYIMRFQPDTERIIWLGAKDCENTNSPKCHAEAHYSTDHGRNWDFVDSYVVNCAWAADNKLQADPTEIICESYRTKTGNQRTFKPHLNPLELVEGKAFYRRKKTRLFPAVVGFAKFSEYLIVAELKEDRGNTLELQVSLDGVQFASGKFPPSLKPETHAYTVLDSSTDSLFLHMTTSEYPFPFWGALLKSNSNGTYFNLILENVNRNQEGYVDFEKVIGLDGIALTNIVTNPNEARMNGGHKLIQSRITHNDGGNWRALDPPEVDSQGNPYPDCADNSASCTLNIHGYTERRDPRATFSSPSALGIILAVGNVGKSLKPYTESDTFLSRDGGFSWVEVRKDAHLWEFGDSGSLLVLANDEEPTDRVYFSTNEGRSWRDYVFAAPGEEKIRVDSLVTVNEDTARKFILFGKKPRAQNSVAIHLDFTKLTTKKCQFDAANEANDDFVKWSPSEQRNEVCLFGQQTIYYRKAPEANCFVGEKETKKKEVKTCACQDVDFECEFNHERDASGACVLVAGTSARPDEEPYSPHSTCQISSPEHDGYWYSRTAYRKITYSKCQGGNRIDRGARHVCPGSLQSHSGWFWLFVLFVPLLFAGLVGIYYYRKSGLARGYIRLPGDSRPFSSGEGLLDTLASVPWFLVGVAGVAWEWVVERVDGIWPGNRTRMGYRDLPVDEDAQILRFEDEE